AGNLYGISFAVANMSGFVARACSDQPAVQGTGRLQSIKVALAGAAGREWAECPQPHPERPGME
ncbi:MAG: hypothetical protein JWN59_1363, partial [Sphingomonas bacterium]|nr:hypothetical protein [Sphingomonas bacterium]